MTCPAIQNKVALLVISMCLHIGGYGFLIWADPKVALGVLLLLWGRNIDRTQRDRL